MRTQRYSRTHSAFTLVELLVVVGIIAVLIAILMPALNKAREHANRVKCAANLRGIGQALTMYVQQYGYYPCHAAVSGGPGGGEGFAVWPTRLRPFLNGTQGAFHCPAQDVALEWKPGEAPGAGIVGRAASIHVGYGYEVGEPLLELLRVPFSYGYNLWGVGPPSAPIEQQRGLGAVIQSDMPTVYKEMKASRVRSASEMIAITDSRGDGMFDFGVIPDRGNPAECPSGVHNRGANALFCDGHVQWYTLDDLLVGAEKGKPVPPGDDQRRRMWNNDNKP